MDLDAARLFWRTRRSYPPRPARPVYAYLLLEVPAGQAHQDSNLVSAWALVQGRAYVCWSPETEKPRPQPHQNHAGRLELHEPMHIRDASFGGARLLAGTNGSSRYKAQG